ncbi:bifunctional DNA-binding transcriptional regulator/O6-methylguanine-DNA methyltransferase Ada [Halopseudomonas salina]|nr:bifunctional DNA-binding transcriptional regulator/O6-methylguanine-DNA methyltransferase Ada [Halopseudomonas salina]
MNEPHPGGPISTADDPRWQQVLARDSAADSLFWYSVITTGIYCRPSCPSRMANPQNVRIHDSLAAAKATGCRPCLRCSPDAPTRRQQDSALVTAACRLLEGSGASLTLDQLACELRMSASHLHRTFKAVTGITPKAYARAWREARLRQKLEQAPSVTEAMFAAGFNSFSGFYQQSTRALGMTPMTYRAGGPREQLHFAVGDTSLGAILVASSARGIVCVTLGDDPEQLIRDLQDRFPAASLIGADEDYERVVAQVVGLVEAPAKGLDLPLDVRGTAFQQRVWQALRAIPCGQTMSYAEVARDIGQPTSARAVARACGANAIALAIPCHRVVRQDGGLSGYRWGIERKRVLLERETDYASSSGAPEAPSGT